MNHFTLLNLPESFDLDAAALESAYFREQRAWHPDRFVAKPPEERAAAASRSADLNKAYETLKNPLKRAQHLLASQGIRVGGESDSIKPSHALLTEAMELRENPLSPDALNAMIAASEQQLSAHFVGSDWQAVAEETLRLGYLLKART